MSDAVIVGMLALVGVLWGSWMTYITAKTHKAVNSERSIMQAEVARLNMVNAALSVTVARLEGLLQVAERRLDVKR